MPYVRSGRSDVVGDTMTIGSDVDTAAVGSVLVAAGAQSVLA